ncbi:DMT family transporter [Bordetella genomosp. 4]|nr:DMT family transporter [Bordetella genomosp. 4]
MPSNTNYQRMQVQGASNLGGVLWALAGMGLFSFIYVSGKLSGTGASALQIMWLRYVGGFATMALALLTQRDIARALSTAQPVLHACRAAAGGLGGVAAIFAAAHMPVASASAIGLMDGLLTVLLGVIVLREHVSLRQWMATIVSLAGAMTVVGSQGAFSAWGTDSAGPAFIALLGALLVALESILIKTLVHAESTFTVLFYVNFFGSLILAWPGLANWHGIPVQWLLAFLMLGPVAILAQYCNINAFRRASASVVGPIRYSWVVYGAAFGMLFFNEPISLATGIGITLVLVGGGWLATSKA